METAGVGREECSGTIGQREGKQDKGNTMQGKRQAEVNDLTLSYQLLKTKKKKKKATSI